MAVIGLIGPHAVGKTTAVLRWVDRYAGKLIGVVADNQWEIHSREERVRVREWKGTKEQKIAACMDCKRRPKVCVIDSARGFSTWMSVLEPTDPVIVLTCPEPAGRRWIEERRANNSQNPKPLSDYWTPKRLDYECNAHLLNYVKKLHPAQVKHFVIEDRGRDWLEVDEYFGVLFRRLHNAILQEKQLQ